MKPAPSTPAAAPESTAAGSTAGGTTLSLRRLYLLRFGYLVMGGGLAIFKWPSILATAGSWTLLEGVVNSMLIAMSLLALLGLRYPVKMLPILLFESLWKLTWLAAVAVPQLIGDRMDAATTELLGKNLWVVVILAVVPWRYVARQYLTAPGDRWRSAPAAPTANRP
jgi:hypothetical protein